MTGLGFGFGMIVGFSLGLTGGGGSIFAVPLLVYGLSVPAREAVVVSLAAVGTTTFVGTVQRMAAREIDVKIGMMFAVAGMLGAPLGSLVGGLIPETVLLILFSILMVLVGVRMWVGSRKKETLALRAPLSPLSHQGHRMACIPDSTGRLTMTSRCALFLVAVGALTGVFSGLFGVGGGFIIVPALVMTAGINIHRAVATSLLVITLVSASGVASYLMAGREIDLELTGVFAGGGVAGLLIGIFVNRWLSGARLQGVFAVLILAVALFVVARTLIL